MTTLNTTATNAKLNNAELNAVKKQVALNKTATKQIASLKEQLEALSTKLEQCDLSTDAGKKEASKLKTQIRYKTVITETDNATLNYACARGVNLATIARNKYGKILYVAECATKKTLAINADKYEQAVYMKQYLQSCFNNGALTKADSHTCSAGKMGENMGTLDDFGKPKGMDGSTQPYAVINALEVLTGAKREKGASWKATKITLTTDHKLFNDLYQIIAQ